MITDEERLLWRAVVEEPTQPGVAEVYADWLLEHDPRRGAILRAHLSDAVSLDQRLDEGRLWASALGLPGALQDIAFDPVPRALRWDADRIAEAGAIFSRLPFLEARLHFSPSSDARAVFACPAVAEIRALSFLAYFDSYEPGEAGVYDRECHYFGDAVLEALCASPHVAELDALTVSDHEIGRRAGTLIAGGRFARLRKLSMSEKIGDHGAIALAGSSVVKSLRYLCLRDCGITTSGALAFAGSPNLTNLEELHLGANPIGARAVAAIRSSKHLTSLRTLVVDR